MIEVEDLGELAAAPPLEGDARVAGCRWASAAHAAAEV
jgi:hypothetical protein